MRFLIDASLPRSAGELLNSLGREAVDVRDIGLRHAPDDLIANHAQQIHAVLGTRDFDFADIRNYPPRNYDGIVVLHLPDDATALQVVNLLELFAMQRDLLTALPHHLAIVEFGGVRIRSS